MTRKHPLLILNNSKECNRAVELLNDNEVLFVPLYVDNNYTTLPSLISDGYSYKGIEDIRIYISLTNDKEEQYSYK